MKPIVVLDRLKSESSCINILAGFSLENSWKANQKLPQSKIVNIQSCAIAKNMAAKECMEMHVHNAVKEIMRTKRNNYAIFWWRKLMMKDE